MSNSVRVADYPVAPVFVERWSPRSFTGEEIPDEVLLTSFEAARWAPSSFNSQPWRFLYAKRGTPEWETFLGLLLEFNRSWAEAASALIVVVSKTTLLWDGKEVPARSHSFDTGAAWSAFAHQTKLSGWAAHAVGGFDLDKTRQVLEIPEGYEVQVAIVVGRQGPAEALPEKLKQREVPSPRKPVSELVGVGAFRFK